MSPAARKSAVATEDIFTVEIGSRHTAWVRGPAVMRMLDRLGIPKLYDHDAEAWSIPRKRVVDVTRDLDRRGRAVEVTEVDR